MSLELWNEFLRDEKRVWISRGKRAIGVWVIEGLLYIAVGKRSIGINNHYENVPIQIYRKFLLQKLKIFR